MTSAPTNHVTIAFSLPRSRFSLPATAFLHHHPPKHASSRQPTRLSWPNAPLNPSPILIHRKAFILHARRPPRTHDNPCPPGARARHLSRHEHEHRHGSSKPAREILQRRLLDRREHLCRRKRWYAPAHDAGKGVKIIFSNDDAQTAFSINDLPSWLAGRGHSQAQGRR